MNFPNKIKIKNIFYKIEYVNTGREVDNNFRYENSLGQIDYENKVIRVLIKNRTIEYFAFTFGTEIVQFLTNNCYTTITRPKITKRKQ